MNLAMCCAQALIENCRAPVPRHAPGWVRDCTQRFGELLINRHLYRSSEAWGLARQFPNQELPYDEIGSQRFMVYAEQFDLFERVGGWNEETRQKTIRFWQAWQNPKTGRFQDPRDPARVVNEKYVVNLLRELGTHPLHPWTTTSASGKVETGIFLQRTKSDPDWQNGGWGVGSHTGMMAVQICEAVTQGREDLIPDLEEGLQNILAHQDPNSGLWGSPTASLAGRIGGTLKVVARTWFRLGLLTAHREALADSLIKYQANGDFYRCSTDMCIERNVCEVAAYCLETSSYRREELLGVLERVAEVMREHINRDGSVSWHRGETAEGGGDAIIIIYPLGICGAYLNWEDAPFPNPLAAPDLSRGLTLPWRPVLLRDGSVRMIRQVVTGGPVCQVNRPASGGKP